jgi:hypothetical protein
MLFSASIARNILCVYFINRVAYKATIFTTEAISREIRREVTIMLREVIIAAIESKSNYIIYRDFLKPFTYISKQIVSD